MQNHPMKISTPFLFAFLFAASCGNDSSKPAGANQPAPDTAISAQSADSLSGGIFLDGLYATSTAPGQDAIRLFDDDPKTGWQTRPGAGPDEGLMLYFSNATDVRIKYVETQAFPGSSFEKEALIQLYVNGQPIKAGAPGERITVEDKDGKGLKVNSLFLRFAETGVEEVTQRSIPTQDQDIQISAFPADGFVGLQTLTLFNDKGEALHIIPPKRVPGQVTASSTLAPESAYGPDNLFDSRKEFAWAEGNPATDGVNETLQFTFEQPVRITAVQIWNGYQRSPEHYKANARVRDFQISGGSAAPQTFTLRDDQAGQKIEFPSAIEGKNFELKIASVYPGKKYKDLAISDMVFYNGAQPFVLSSGQSAQRQQLFRSKAASSPLASLLDRRLHNLVESPFDATAQSLVLRSDGTFVLYLETTTTDESEKVISTTGETIADGNWELLESTGGVAKVKVFGKWFDYSEVMEWYKGPTNREVTKIFNDVLTIDNNTVKGSKMIGTFYRK